MKKLPNPDSTVVVTDLIMVKNDLRKILDALINSPVGTFIGIRIYTWSKVDKRVLRHSLIFRRVSRKKYVLDTVFFSAPKEYTSKEKTLTEAWSFIKKHWSSIPKRHRKEIIQGAIKID